MALNRRNPIWPYLLVLAALFALSIAAPRGWRRSGQETPADDAALSRRRTRNRRWRPRSCVRQRLPTTVRGPMPFPIRSPRKPRHSLRRRSKGSAIALRHRPKPPARRTHRRSSAARFGQPTKTCCRRSRHFPANTPRQPKNQRQWSRPMTAPDIQRSRRRLIRRPRRLHRNRPRPSQQQRLNRRPPIRPLR